MLCVCHGRLRHSTRGVEGCVRGVQGQFSWYKRTLALLPPAPSCSLSHSSSHSLSHLWPNEASDCLLHLSLAGDLTPVKGGGREWMIGHLSAGGMVHTGAPGSNINQGKGTTSCWQPPTVNPDPEWCIQAPGSDQMHKLGPDPVHSSP